MPWHCLLCDPAHGSRSAPGVITTNLRGLSRRAGLKEKWDLDPPDDRALPLGGFGMEGGNPPAWIEKYLDDGELAGLVVFSLERAAPK